MIDIIIPTIRTPAEVAPLIAEIQRTAGYECRVLATCTPGSASVNRNIGLNWAESDPLIMVDDDIAELPQGWAVKLIDVLEQYPECVMVSAQLATPNGTPGPMMGGCSVQKQGVTAAAERKLPTACIAVRRNALRYDEAFPGSGREDNEMAKQLIQLHPDATFLVCHDVWVVHLNQMKLQGEPFWSRTKAYFESKWGHE